jgi:hypothetical protein
MGLSLALTIFRTSEAIEAVENGLPNRLVMAMGGRKSHAVFLWYLQRATLQAYNKLYWGSYP